MTPKRTYLAQNENSYTIKLNSDKTKIVRFNRLERENSNSFDFLGFTFYLGLTRRGAVVPKLKSSGKKLLIKLTRVNLWCKENRNKYSPLALWKTFCSKLRGHIQYYGVSFNYRAVHNFLEKSVEMYFKWINRRSQKKTMNNDKFHLFLIKFPTPKSKISHKLF